MSPFWLARVANYCTVFVVSLCGEALVLPPPIVFRPSTFPSTSVCVAVIATTGCVAAPSFVQRDGCLLCLYLKVFLRSLPSSCEFLVVTCLFARVGGTFRVDIVVAIHHVLSQRTPRLICRSACVLGERAVNNVVHTAARSFAFVLCVLSRACCIRV